ncbi:MAG: tetratricopeptide repeat protein [Gemmatimonadetes bacterium]|nr:tetratricopeptide repeat protein [Gemmatimonadota bacterium]
MRRLTNSRDNLPDDQALLGSDPLTQEGDLLTPSLDAIGSLRPFGRDVPEQRLGTILTPDAAAGASALRRSATLAGAGRRLDAIALLRQVIEEGPDAVEARVALAELHGSASDWEAALAELTLALDGGATAAPTLVLRGAFHAQAGQTREAERDFREAVKQDPSYWLAYRYLGSTRLRNGASREAIEVLREAHSLAPQDAESALLLGEALLAHGELVEGHRVLLLAIELGPRDPRGFLVLGRLLDRLGRTDEAMAMHRKAREVTPA